MWSAHHNMVAVSEERKREGRTTVPEGRDEEAARAVGKPQTWKPDERGGESREEPGRRAVRASWSAHHNMLAVRSSSGREEARCPRVEMKRWDVLREAKDMEAR